MSTLILWPNYSRSRKRSKQSNSSCHTRGFFEPLEAIDSTKLPPETEDDKVECIELNECDEMNDKDGENEFIDTIPTGKFAQ